MEEASRLWDAIVVGAGPAGASCALELARRNLSVLILEARSWPRYKTCGGGLVWRARRAAGIDLGPAVEVETHRAELHLHDCETRFIVQRDFPLVSMTMRHRLDQELVSGAQAAGARMLTETRVDRLAIDKGHWSVGAAGHSFAAHYVVAADGARSPTARLAGWPAHTHFAAALETEIEVDSRTRARFAQAARFDFGFVPVGYAWVFPKQRGLSVGCLSLDGRAVDLKRSLSHYIEHLELDPLAREDHGFVIPLRPRSAHLAENRVLLAGDAAGLADPVTCEGIFHALISGRLAAQAIAAHGRKAGQVERAYLLSLDDFILGELRWARLLSAVLYRTPHLRRFLFRHAGQSLSEAMVRVISGHSSYRQLLGDPRLYLRALARL